MIRCPESSQPVWSLVSETRIYWALVEHKYWTLVITVSCGSLSRLEHLNQCWIIVNQTPVNIIQRVGIKPHQSRWKKCVLKNVICEMLANLFMPYTLSVTMISGWTKTINYKTIKRLTCAHTLCSLAIFIINNSQMTETQPLPDSYYIMSWHVHITVTS